HDCHKGQDGGRSSRRNRRPKAAEKEVRKGGAPSLLVFGPRAFFEILSCRSSFAKRATLLEKNLPGKRQHPGLVETSRTNRSDPIEAPGRTLAFLECCFCCSEIGNSVRHAPDEISRPLRKRLGRKWTKPALSTQRRSRNPKTIFGCCAY